MKGIIISFHLFQSYKNRHCFRRWNNKKNSREKQKVTSTSNPAVLHTKQHRYDTKKCNTKSTKGKFRSVQFFIGCRRLGSYQSSWQRRSGSNVESRSSKSEVSDTQYIFFTLISIHKTFTRTTCSCFWTVESLWSDTPGMSVLSDGWEILLTSKYILGNILYVQCEPLMFGRTLPVTSRVV